MAQPVDHEWTRVPSHQRYSLRKEPTHLRYVLATPGLKEQKNTAFSFPPPPLQFSNRAYSQKPISDTGTLVGAHPTMFVIRLWRREPTHNLWNLVESIKGLAMTPYWVASVGIGVAEFDPLCIGNLGNDFLSGVLVECRNGRKERYLELVGQGFTKLSVGKAKKMAGWCGCSCGNNPTIQSFPCQEYTKIMRVCWIMGTWHGITDSCQTQHNAVHT